VSKDLSATIGQDGSDDGARWPEHPLRELVERVPAVLFVAEDGRPVYVSPAAETVLGQPADVYVAEPWRWHAERARLHELSTTIEVDGVSRTYGALVADEPSVDPTTRLPGLGLLREHLRLAAARARQYDEQVALLHVGLDGLDLVAAGLGRDAREHVVREVAARVRAAMPETALVASIGDGDLAVMLTDLDGGADEVVETAAAQVIVAAGQPLRVDGEEFELTGQVGASLLPRDAADVEGLLRHAQTALRQVRGNEHARVLLYAGGTSEALERLLVTARLRRALERDELVLHYQPIFRLPSGSIMGVEALLRWQDPERGLVPPLDFIPVAEYTGLIEPIGRWVVDECCRQSVAWREEGLTIPISFNVSLRQFREASFAAALGERIRADGLDPTLFMVEITESVAMRDPACVEPVLGELRRMGVRLAIDDFGAGHSSLSRLRDLEVDMLKIDRGLLAQATSDERAGRLVRAALDLVEALDMTPVAEGVETEQQRRFLVDRGCGLAQGFHLARPLPAAEVGALLRSQRASSG
jgi:diguanylate cyclase (GGDEF)-like protein